MKLQIYIPPCCHRSLQTITQTLFRSPKEWKNKRGQRKPLESHKITQCWQWKRRDVSVKKLPYHQFNIFFYTMAKYWYAILSQKSPFHPLILQILSLWKLKAELLNSLCWLLRIFPMNWGQLWDFPALQYSGCRLLACRGHRWCP